MGSLKTSWGEKPNEHAWSESYPRPSMRREHWLSLDGWWDYGITPCTYAERPPFKEKILVPFCPESELSGVKHVLQPTEKLWYRRYFEVPSGWKGKRVLLHFGVVDYECAVYVNGKEVIHHIGGYNPFQADITDFMQEKENELVVWAVDPTDTSDQPHGKQSLNPMYIYYTSVSGIWQSVWLEPVPENYVEELEIEPDFGCHCISLTVFMNGKNAAWKAKILDENEVCIAEGDGKNGVPEQINLPRTIAWTPENPYLYTVLVNAGEDTVTSYFALRTISLQKSENGDVKICLNEKEIFQVGILDQGYWPDGLYTPPSDEAMLQELKRIKELGFRVIRKHVKVEPERWYYYCDRLGMLVWQDIVSSGNPLGSIPQMLEMSKSLTSNCGLKDDTQEAYRTIGKPELAQREAFEAEMLETVQHLKKFPCIVVWVLFNESWGQFDSARLTDVIKGADSTRLVDANSGWADQGCGDLHTFHTYAPAFDKPIEVESDRQRAWAISECGGFTYQEPGHIWNQEKFGYEDFANYKELSQAYRDFFGKVVPKLKESGCAAVIYTQLTDVEGEANGLYTYDRKVLKIPEKLIRRLNQSLLDENKMSGSI